MKDQEETKEGIKEEISTETEMKDQLNATIANKMGTLLKIAKMKKLKELTDLREMTEMTEAQTKE